MTPAVFHVLLALARGTTHGSRIAERVQFSRARGSTAAASAV